MAETQPESKMAAALNHTVSKSSVSGLMASFFGKLLPMTIALRTAGICLRRCSDVTSSFAVPIDGAQAIVDAY